MANPDRHRQLAEASKIGGEATRLKFDARHRDAIEALRGQWEDPRYETREIVEASGVSLNTLNKYMGATRRQAVRAARARLQALAHKERDG